MTSLHVPAQVAALLDTTRELSREEMDTLTRYANQQWAELTANAGEESR